MVRATRILEVIEEEKLVEHTAEVGEVMLTGLENIAEESKEILTNVRGRGLMIAFDLPNEAKRDTMIDKMFDNGLMALKCGDQSIRFRGMLDTPKDVIDQALEIVARSIPEK